MKTMQGLKKEPLMGSGVSLLHCIATGKLSPSALSPEKIRGPHARVPAGHLRSILLSGGACSAHFDAAEAARNHLKIISHLCKGQWQFSLFFFSVGVIVMPSGEKP